MIPSAPTRRAFLRRSLGMAVTAAECAITAVGLTVLGRGAYYRILTLGVTDRRYLPEAMLSPTEQPAIPFADLRDGETLLGKRVRVPVTAQPQGGIDVELGFMTAATGRELRLRIPPKTFRITNDWDGVPVAQFILDVIREDRARVRLCSPHGAALVEAVRCGDIGVQLRDLPQRAIVITDIPFELRAPFVEHGTRELHFERVD